MAYKRKKYSTKRKSYKAYGKSKRYYKKAPVSKQANKLIPKVNTTAERKQIYGNLTDTRLNTTSNTNCINPMAQGTADGTRVGDKVVFKSLDIRLRVYSTIPTSVRLILFIDTKPKSSYPGLSDVLDSNDPQTGSYGVMSHRNKINLARYVILFDKWFTFNPQISSTVQEKVFHFYKKLNLGTDYSRGNAQTYADIETNAIYLMGLSNNINGTNNPYYSYTVKLNYIDA